MKEKILEIANSIGIDIIGFTNVLDYSYLSNYFMERANKGYNCEFEEQNLSKRFNVKSLLPECKSIIAIGVPYGLGYSKPIAKDKGLLSIVSYGENYHIKLTNILTNLVEEIKQHMPFKYKICVDTSPLIDREICKNAGIGSYGKNTLLYNKDYGSFINLGYILTDLDIECNNITHNINICGDCNKCINSCPNNAILSEGGINARRCISYLTQTKEPIREEYIKNIRNQIYGCDICQVVCPMNKIKFDKLLNIDYNNLLIDLKELMQITNKDFQLKYGSLSGSWRGRNVWKRNALIAIGNLKLIDLYDVVKEELDNPSLMIKTYAKWCLDRLEEVI